jgi:hypothetical protein
MIRTLTLAAVIGAFALPAMAADVSVNVAGLDAKAAHEKIVDAARHACSLELSTGNNVVEYYTKDQCVAEATATAEAKLQAQADASHRLARL